MAMLYSAIGITLNSNMPDLVRGWGCGQLQANFSNALPPHGCEGPDGRWM
ncbi:hypothetical protein QBK99_18360 [Corticibacterium sp. UT-5YL-CI-8]|nr:hypothetical protein [Tianweitania sp. UT-5YL-CI-8]